MNRARPPRLPHLMLRMLVPEALREPVLGDLHEGYRQRVGAGAGVWYWRESIRSVIPMLLWRARYGPALRRVIAAWLAVVSMGIVFAGLTMSISSLLPEGFLEGIRHIGRGAPAQDAQATVLGVLFFSFCLFVGSTVGARIHAMVAGGRWPTAIALACLWIGPAILGWAAESTGSELLWIRLVFVGACVSGVIVGLYPGGGGVALNQRPSESRRATRFV